MKGGRKEEEQAHVHMAESFPSIGNEEVIYLIAGIHVLPISTRRKKKRRGIIWERW